MYMEKNGGRLKYTPVFLYHETFKNPNSGFLSLSLSLTTQGVGLREYFVYKYFPFSFFTFIPFFTICFLFSLLSSKLYVLQIFVNPYLCHFFKKY